MRLIQGDCLAVLKTLPDNSVQCVVTSPPYYGLRDYGTARWEGGDPSCDHISGTENPRSSRPLGLFHGGDDRFHLTPYKNVCGKCGAVRIDNQIGLEPTPDEYVARLVEVFREVRRVLRDDGTLWLNLGDSYYSTNGGNTGGCSPKSTLGGGGGKYRQGSKNESMYLSSVKLVKTYDTSGKLKPKDLIGIPWRVAFALQADGWWLRQDIIWAKPNPMPESVTDRCTKAHEYIFLLTKSARYYYDNEAIMEPSIHAGEIITNSPDGKNNQMGVYGQTRTGFIGSVTIKENRNRRSVWTVSTTPYKGAHFATFPPKLIEPCILAGTSERGCCPICGKTWERISERVSIGKRYSTGKSADKNSKGLVTAFSGYDDGSSCPQFRTIGWRPTCECNAGDPIPCTVLDPFNGAGTTGLVALQLGRDYIGIELNQEYITLTEKRLSGIQVVLSCAA